MKIRLSASCAAAALASAFWCLPSAARGAAELAENGFPTESNYAEGVGETVSQSDVSTSAYNYAGKHLKVVLTTKASSKTMGAVTAESLWLSSSSKARLILSDSTLTKVPEVFVNGCNLWTNAKDVTVPGTMTVGTGGSAHDGSNNYGNAALRLGYNLTVKGAFTVPEGQVVKVAPGAAGKRLTLSGGLYGAGTLRLGGSHAGDAGTLAVTGGTFTGTLGLYNDASAKSSGTITLNGADLCPALDMRDVKNGSITVNISQPMGLNNGSQLTAGQLNLTGIPGTETAAFTVAAGAAVTVGEGLTLNLPASAQPAPGETGTYKLFDLSAEGASVTGSLEGAQIRFNNLIPGTGAATAALGEDGTLTLTVPAAASVELDENGFPAASNYAEGVGTALTQESVADSAYSYAGKHLKITLTKIDGQKNMGAVTAASLWITGNPATRFRVAAASLASVPQIFLSNVNMWVKDAAATVPGKMTVGTGGTSTTGDSGNCYEHAAFRLSNNLTVNGAFTVPAGQIVRAATDETVNAELSLQGGLYGSGELRVSGDYKGTKTTVLKVAGGTFTGTLGLYNAYTDKASKGTITLDGAELCPTLDMAPVTKGSLTVNVSQPMGLNKGTQLTAGRLNITGDAFASLAEGKAAFTLAPGAAVAVGEDVVINLPASCTPKAGQTMTFRLFDVSAEGAALFGNLKLSNLLFDGKAADAAVFSPELSADGVLTVGDAPVLDGTAMTTITASAEAFTPAAGESASAKILLGSGTESIAFQALTVDALELNTEAGAPAALTLSGSLTAPAGVSLTGSIPARVVFAPAAGDTLTFGLNAAKKGPFNGAADALVFDGAGTVSYHLGALEEAAGRNLAAQIIAQGSGTYTVIADGDDANMVLDDETFTAERPVIHVKGGAALTLQPRNFVGWDAQQGSGAFLPGIVTLLDGGADAAQTATLNRIPLMNGETPRTDQLLSPIWFKGFSTMTLDPAGDVNIYRASETDAVFKAFDGAAAVITTRPGAKGVAAIDIQNKSNPIVEVGADATLTLDVILSDSNAGTVTTKRGAGTLVLTQANTSKTCLTIAEGGLTFSGAAAAWAGGITLADGAAFSAVKGGVLDTTALTLGEGCALSVDETSALKIASDQLSAFTPTLAEGAKVLLCVTAADYAAGSVTLPALYAALPAERFTVLDPDGAEIADAVLEGGAFTFSVPTVSFSQPAGWELTAPEMAVRKQAADTTANTGLVNDTGLRQTVGEREAIVANITGSDKADTVVIAGYPYGADEKTLTQDVWLKISGGDHRFVIGGSDMQNYSGKPRHFTGNSVVNLSGGVADYAFSCNFFDGKASTIKGRHALVIEGDAVLKGSAAATAAIHGPGVTYAEGVELNITVRNLQNDNSASNGVGITPGWTGSTSLSAGFLVGGGISTRSNAPHQITGNTSVCIELPETLTEGAFSKTLVGGSYSTQGSGTSSLSGTAQVKVSALAGITFDRPIIGGSYATGNAAMTTGSSAVSLTGGTYTGTITAGSLGANAKTTGAAALTLDGGADVSQATLQLGNAASGTLTVKTSAAPKALLGLFTAVNTAEGAVLTLPAGADLSQALGSFTLDAAALETLTLQGAAKAAFTALPTAGLAIVNLPAGVEALTYAVPEGIDISGLSCTIEGIAVTPVLEGAVLTLPVPQAAGPFTAEVSADAALEDLVWLNAAGERAINTAYALAQEGAVINVSAAAALTLTENYASEQTLTVNVAEGAALTFTGSGALALPVSAAGTLTLAGSARVNSTVTLSGALEIAGSAYAKAVALSAASDTLTLNLGSGSGKHADMVGTVSGPGELRIYATGGTWDAGSASGSTLFASRMAVEKLTGCIRLGNGTNGIRCAPKTFPNQVSCTIILGKGCMFQQNDTWGNSAYPCKLPLQVSSGAHLQNGSWGTSGAGVVRSGYTVNFNSPVSGVSAEGEEPALVNAYAGTGAVNFNTTVTGDGVATGSWGSGEKKALVYTLNNAANNFRMLLIRNMMLSTTSQVGTTVNAGKGGLGGSAVTYGTENKQANKSTLNVNGDNTIASITASNGGNLNLAKGVTLTVEGAADLTGLTALTLTLPDDYTGAALLCPLQAKTLTLDPAKVTIKQGGATAEYTVRVLGGSLVIGAVPFAESLAAEAEALVPAARLALEQAAAAAGASEITDLGVLTGGVRTAGAEAVNNAAACFAGLTAEGDAAGVVTLAYDFGIADLRAAADGETLTAAAEVRGGTYAEGLCFDLVFEDGSVLEIPAETITQEAGGSRITFPLSAAQVAGKPFRIRARTPEGE